jgi:hypothetical protein
MSPSMARVVARYDRARFAPVLAHVAMLSHEELVVLAVVLLDQAGLSEVDQERVLALRSCQEVER